MSSQTKSFLRSVISTHGTWPFFCLQFFSGDRASDLGRVFTKEVLALPDNEGLLFNHTFGKTLRGKDTNSFMVKRCHNPTICPVSNLRLYVDLCDLMSVNVRDGQLFRSMDRKGQFQTSLLLARPLRIALPLTSELLASTRGKLFIASEVGVP